MNEISIKLSNTKRKLKKFKRQKNITLVIQT